MSLTYAIWWNLLSKCPTSPVSAQIFRMAGDSEGQTSKSGSFSAILYPMDLQAKIKFLRKSLIVVIDISIA